MKRETRPDLFVIGAPKSGTTSIYEYLRGHPEIYMSPVKEPMYFSPDVVWIGQQFIHPVDEDRYLALFAGARGATRVGEASTHYIRSRVAPRLIHAWQPAARIVAILRDPVDVLHALHNERVSFRLEEILDFREALAADDDRRSGRRLPRGGSPVATVYREAVQLGSQLRRWIDVFGRDRVHVMLLDDLVADPAATFRGLLDFLEVDPTYQPASFAVHNRSHRRRDGLVAALLRRARARRLANSVVPRLIGEGRAMGLIARARRSRLVRPASPRAPVPVDLRDQLRAELAGEVSLLGELIGRDLRALWWDG